MSFKIVTASNTQLKHVIFWTASHVANTHFICRTQKLKMYGEVTNRERLKD